MPPRIELEHQRDFTGGLNLADDPYNLAKNETFDLQNVDIDRRGGFGIRRGSRAFITTATGLTASGTPDSGHTYKDASLNYHILAARDGHVKRWDGAAWQDVIAAPGGSGRTTFVEMNNYVYIRGGSNTIPDRWDGTTVTVMSDASAAYNDDLTSPAGGTMPGCFVMAQHHEVMWAAYVYESATTNWHSSRIRWSHPGTAEDWRELDYIDIDREDENGNITALVPFGDRLLVFKERAVYAVHGYPPDGFSVVNLTKEVGTPSAWSVVATEQAVYFWDTQTGAWAYDGKNFVHIFRPLFPLIEDNKINNPFSFQVIAEFHNERLWLSVPFLTAPFENRFVSMVFSPDAGENGAWTIHTKTFFGWWKHRGSDGGDVHLIGGDGVASGGYVMELDVDELYTDQDGVGDPYPIEAHYTTRWFDAKNPALKKRWKRPIVVMRAGAAQTTVVDVLKDYDPTRVQKSFQIVQELDGTEGEWDVDDWDDGLWAAATTLGGERSEIRRGAPLGTGTAKALRLKNTTMGQDWRVHGITMKWISKRIRN